ALASILLMEQDILVIDEPTSQLDPQSKDDVFEVIKLMKDMGRTIVLVEHKMEQIARYSDHIVVLDQGRVVLEGAPRDVITNPDCAKYHTRLPQCTNIGLGLKERGVDLGGLPITNDEAAAQIRNYMGR
ncbi:MAG: ABC transporter ATP-binding protein, partial [Clostridium sp.]|nr:ABC transporter ATP-binding protein [Clostridium sp.]